MRMKARRTIHKWNLCFISLMIVSTMFSPLTSMQATTNFEPIIDVKGNGLTGSAEEGYVVDIGSNNWIGSSTYATAFEYEATVKFEEGANLASLVFGANAAGEQLGLAPNTFFALEIAKDNTDIMVQVFHENGYGMGILNRTKAATLQNATDPIKVKIAVDDEKNFQLFINDQPIDVSLHEAFKTLYQGGYLGFGSCESKTKFTGVQAKISTRGTPPEEKILHNIKTIGGSAFSRINENSYNMKDNGKNNFLGSSIKHTSLQYKAEVNFKSGLNLATLIIGAEKSGSQIGDEPFYGIELSARDAGNGLHDMYIQMFHEYASGSLIPSTLVVRGKDIKKPISFEVTVDAMSNLNIFVDGIRANFNQSEVFKSIYKGGYLGMLNHRTDVDFNNVQYFTNDPTDPGFETNLEGWVPTGTVWNENAYGYTGAGNGDIFAIANRKLAKDEPFVFESDIDFSGNFGAGLVFGVEDPKNPTKQWLCMNIEKVGNISKIFHNIEGQGTLTDVQHALSDGQRKSELHHLKVTYDGKQNFDFYLNGVKTKSLILDRYHGGYVGIMGFNSTATFTNTYLYKNEPLYIDDVAFEGATLDTAFDAEQRYYFATAEHASDKVKLQIHASEDYTISINNNVVDNGVFSNEIAVGVGYTTLNVKIQDEAKRTKEYYFTVYRKFDPLTEYNDSYRPSYHFTPFRYQMNDPNGLVYNEVTKEYNMYFQTNRGIPNITGNGTTSWGHAVSKDLMSWEELPLAITPDELGVIYSGSSIIDRDNTSGLFDETTPPGARIIAFYTNMGGKTEGIGQGKQSLAYSIDNGKTFIKYKGNPVVKNPNNMYGAGMRDPKVFWYEDESYKNGGIWVMVAADADAFIFTSENLIDWEYNSTMEFDNTVECPDLYPLKVEGKKETKWIFSAGGTFYVIGELVKKDGKFKFIQESEEIVPLEGFVPQFPNVPVPESYAAQSYYNDPYGRRITQSWIRDGVTNHQDKQWNSGQTLPMETTLREVNGELRLLKYPSIEVNDYREQNVLSIRDVVVNEEDENILKDVKGKHYDIEAIFTPGTAKEFGFKAYVGNNNQYILVKYNTEDHKLYVDKHKAGDGWVGTYKPELLPMKDGKVKIRMMIDSSLLDVYGNEGEQQITGFIYPTMIEGYEGKVEFFSDGGNVKVNSLDVYNMKTMSRTVVDREKSIDLTLSTGLLNPAFNEAVKEYRIDVDYNIETFAIKPTYKGYNSVTVNGKEVKTDKYSETLALVEGSNKVILTLDGSEYVINVNRAKAPIILHKDNLTSLLATAGELEKTIYSADSWKNLQENITSAKAILANATLQKQLDEAYNLLKQAIEDLVMVDDEMKDRILSSLDGNILVSGKMKQDIVMKAKKIENMKSILDKLNDKNLLSIYNVEEIYDISLLLDGVSVQPDGMLQVKIKMNPALHDKKLRIAHFGEDGSVHFIGSEIKEGFITFSTLQLSKFAVLSEKKTTIPDEEDNPSDIVIPGVDKPVDDNVNTGDDSHVVTFISLLAIAGLSILYTRRKVKG